jgi:aryl-alcohol dehydrogenase-like predicted oxidoreductase
MHHRTLGPSGTVVTALCLGTMTFGAETDETTAFAMMDTYAAAGGNFLDTADVYSRGLSEEITGRWLAARPAVAAQMVIATKARFPMGAGPNDLGLSRRHLARALDASLRRLAIDRIDLYQMHAWDALTPVEETMRFLDDAIAAGKIAYWGVSNWLGWQIAKSVQIARHQRWAAPVTLQPQYNLLARDIEHEIVPACRDAGMGLLPWSPLGGGWLSGKYRRGERPAGATRLGENPERGMESWTTRSAQDRTWAVIDTLAAIAGARGVSMAEVALAWLRDRPGVTSVILGARTPDQLAANLRSAALTLSAEETQALNDVSAPQMPDYPYGPLGIAQRHRRIEGGR